jgi:hypothetical protein
VRHVAKLNRYIGAAAEFTRGPLVLDGALDLLAMHARLCACQYTMSYDAQTDPMADPA